MERYRRARGRHIKNEEKPDFKTTIIRQSIICSVIFAVVFVIGLLKTETAVNISHRIQNSISYTVDYQATVKEMVSAINNFTRGTENDEPAKTDKAD